MNTPPLRRPSKADDSNFPAEVDKSLTSKPLSPQPTTTNRPVSFNGGQLPNASPRSPQVCAPARFGNEPSAPPLSASPVDTARGQPNAISEYANNPDLHETDPIDNYNNCTTLAPAPWVEGDKFDADSIQWAKLLDAEAQPKPAALVLVKHHVANGTSGAVSFFDADDGRRLAAKVSVTQGRDWVLGVELRNFRGVTASVGQHRNLVRVHGIAWVFKDGTARQALFLDRVDGPNGEKLRRAMATCAERGYITHAERVGAVQFVGKRLFSVAHHLNKAGMVHCDIKPDNYLLDSRTGEPIVVDLGIASKCGERGLGSPDFRAPEQVQRLDDATQAVDGRADVFGVASTLFALMEGGNGGEMEHIGGASRYPNTGLDLDRVAEQRNGRTVYRAGAPDYRDGVPIRRRGRATIETAYTRFLLRAMAARKEDRPHAIEATMSEFFDYPLTDDDTARDTLRRVATFAMTGNCPRRTARVSFEKQPEDMSVLTVLSKRQKEEIENGRRTLLKSKTAAPVVEPRTVE